MRAFPVCLSLVIVLVWLPSPVAAQPVVEVLHGFVDPPRNPYTAPVQGPDGRLYGTTSEQGGVGDGTIYRIDTAGAFETVHNFRGDDGSDPRGDLILASDGFFYGTTVRGGAANVGTVYRLDPVSGAVTTVHSFTTTTPSGSNPQEGLTQASDPFLYGTTPEGGAEGRGTVYRLNPVSGEVTTVHSFPWTGSGRNPYAGLTQASDGFLYGTTLSGGATGAGTVYRLDPASGAVTIVHSFTDLPSGHDPHAKLTQASDGFLYGTTLSGGADWAGAVFRLDPASGAVATVHSFTSTAPSGQQPFAGLTQASDGFLYGTTYAGGTFAAGAGTIYRLNPASGAVATVHSFTSTAPSGRNPYAGLTQAGDGFLYGTTFMGGGTGDGTVYRLDPASGEVATVRSFNASSPGGSHSQAGLTQASDGILYGTTLHGGADGHGTIYGLDPASGAVATVHSFTSAATSGQQPYSDLTQASDGFLYGTTRNGGVDQVGTIYRLNPATGAVATVPSFTILPSSGKRPVTGLIQASDGFLYGTTPVGGSFNRGTLYRMDPTSGAVATLVIYAGSGNPMPSALIQASDGFLYGTTQVGGAAGLGSIYRRNLGSGSNTTVHSFTAAAPSGRIPIAGLTQGSDGFLYGTTQDGGGAAGQGTIYRLDPASGAVATVHSFTRTAPSGYSPSAALVQASDGFLYGTTFFGGGTGDGGTIYRLDPASGAVATVHSFTGPSGRNPVAGLTEASDGHLYGVTTSGGPLGGGTLFRLVLNSNSAPEAEPGTQTTDEDQPVSGTLVATDADGDPLTFSIVANGTLGTAVITNASTGAYTYTPGADANGNDSFTFQASDGVSTSNVATVSVTIDAANDAPTQIAALAPVEVAEDAPDTVVDLSGVFDDVDIATNGDALTLGIVGNTNPALVSASLTGSALTLDFAAGHSGVATVTVRATDAAGAFVDATLAVTVTPASSSTLSIADVTVTEGNSGTKTMTFRVTVTPPSTNTVTVDWATADDTATAGQDYIAAAGTLTIPGGAASRTFTVAIAGDLVDELDESFLVNLSNPLGAGIADGQALGRITDNDTASIRIANAPVIEGDAGNVPAQFVVSLSVPSVLPISVQYATLTTGSAATGTDYLESAGGVQFAPGETSFVIEVPVVGDLLDERDETFTVALTSPVNATLGDARGVATIADNDDPPAIAIADASVVEGHSGSRVVSLTVTLSAPSGQTVRVDYATAAGTATEGDDFRAAAGRVSFQPGITSRTITIRVNGDGVVEGPESLFVRLSLPTNATIADDEAVVSIVDDEVASVAAAPTLESSGTAHGTLRPHAGVE